MGKLLNYKWMARLAAVCFVTLNISTKAWAAGSPAKSDLDNPLAVILLIIIGALALVIALLGHVLTGVAQLKLDRIKKEKAAKVLSVILLCLVSSSTFAQANSQAVGEVVNATISGLSKFSFYTLITVIGLELAIITWMLWFLKGLLAKEKAITLSGAIERQDKWKNWWTKINGFRSMSEEKDIDMGHEYDNIRELDNKLPSWWLYGFYITIIFAGIYLWRYHISHSAPLSHEELQVELAKAEEEKAIRLQKAGGGVDENTVRMLTAADIEAGKKLFTTTCAPCHAADGGGIVGPNLTDDYWLHGGDIKDVFKTIKYGVPDKGMQPWKGQFSATQLAQLASFIKSIKGSKVANPKEPQGELFKEQAAPPADSTKLAAAK
jgi:cytochrome c oxidase cbb3-type subunit III